MKVKIQEYNNIRDLEFGILKELPKIRVLNSLKNEEEYNVFLNLETNLKKVTSINGVFEVIEKINDGFICSDEEGCEFRLIKGYSKVEVGEIYCLFGDNICKVDNELTDDEKFKGLFIEIDKWVEEKEESYWKENGRRYSRNGLFFINEIEEGEITLEMVENLLLKHKRRIEKIEEGEEEEEVKKEEVKKIKENDEEKIYNAEGIGTFDSCSVQKNIIKGIWDEEFILDKDVNKSFSYEGINGIDSYDGYTILSNVEIFLYSNNIAYTKTKNGATKYKVTYINGKCKIEGINVPKSKQKFILNRLSYGSDKKDIKILLKLNGMKADFVSLEDLQWRDGGLEIPIKNRAIDDKTFKVKFLDKTKTFNWGEVKNMFFYSGRSVNRRFGNKNLLEFCEEMGVSKKDLFETLRRLKMLKELEDKNGS